MRNSSYDVRTLKLTDSFISIDEPEQACIWSFSLDSAVDGDPGHHDDGDHGDHGGDGGDHGGGGGYRMNGLRANGFVVPPPGSDFDSLIEARKQLLG
jgi:hypothetical protein